jgi:hypothetical protein
MYPTTAPVPLNPYAATTVVPTGRGNFTGTAVDEAQTNM